jgi:hypothetical protein
MPGPSANESVTCDAGDLSTQEITEEAQQVLKRMMSFVHVERVSGFAGCEFIASQNASSLQTHDGHVRTTVLETLMLAK